MMRRVQGRRRRRRVQNARRWAHAAHRSSVAPDTLNASYIKVTGICKGTELPMTHTITIERVDHIGIRVRDLDRALAFYRVLGFTLVHRAVGDDVAATSQASVPSPWN